MAYAHGPQMASSPLRTRGRKRTLGRLATVRQSCFLRLTRRKEHCNREVRKGLARLRAFDLGHDGTWQWFRIAIPDGKDIGWIESAVKAMGLDPLQSGPFYGCGTVGIYGTGSGDKGRKKPLTRLRFQEMERDGSGEEIAILAHVFRHRMPALPLLTLEDRLRAFFRTELESEVWTDWADNREYWINRLAQWEARDSHFTTLLEWWISEKENRFNDLDCPLAQEMWHRRLVRLREYLARNPGKDATKLTNLVAFQEATSVTMAVLFCNLDRTGLQGKIRQSSGLTMAMVS